MFNSILKNLSQEEYQNILIEKINKDLKKEYLDYQKLISLIPGVEKQLVLSCSNYNPKQYLGVITIINLLKYFDQLGMLENYSVFNKIKSLNQLRNKAGHRLIELNRSDIKKIVGKNDIKFLNQLKEIILHYFPEITEEYLNVYETAINYIRENLETN